VSLDNMSVGLLCTGIYL